LYTGTPYLVTVTASRSFWAATYNTSTGCLSTRKEVIVTVNARPAPPTNPLQTTAICGSGSTTLSVDAFKSAVSWYTTAPSVDDDIALATGFSYTTPVLSATKTYYAGSKGINGCFSATRIAVTATVGNPSPPTATGGAVCQSGSVTLSASPGAGATSILWENNSGTDLATGTSYATPTITTTTTYRAKSTVQSGQGVCESAYTPAVATVNQPNPGLPTSPDRFFQTPQSLTLTATPGTDGSNVKWYNVISGGSPIATGTTYTTPTLNNTTPYFLTSTNTCGESSTRKQVNVQLVEPDPLTTQTTVYANTVYTYTYNSDGVLTDPQWFITGGVIKNIFPVNSGYGSQATVTWSDPGTGYLKIVKDNWILADADFTIVCKPPSVPTYSLAADYGDGIFRGTVSPICGPAKVKITASAGAGGTKVRWYVDDNPLTNYFLEGTSYTTPSSLSANTVYYISTYNSTYDCQSIRTPVTLNINLRPAAPTNPLQETLLCTSGSTTLTVSASVHFNLVYWYGSQGPDTDAPVLANGFSYTTPTISSNTNYYASVLSANGCESYPRLVVSATITSKPGIPTADPHYRCGPGTVTLTATPASPATAVQWFGTSDLQSPLSTNTPNVTATRSYFVRSKISNATSACYSDPKTVLVTLNTTSPGLPSGLDVAFQNPSTSVSLTATPGTDAYKVRWYNAPSGGLELSANTSYTTPPISQTTTYHVASENSCVVSTNREPVVAIYSPPAALTSATNVETSTLYVYSWSSDANFGGAVWDIVNGTIKTQQLINNGMTSQVTVTWNTPGGGSLKVSENGYVFASSNFTITCKPMSPPNAALFANTGDGIFNPVTSSVCGPAIVRVDAPVVAPGTQVRWFLNDAILTPFYEGTSYTTGTLTGPITYHLSSINTGSGCESTRAPVLLDVKGTSPTPQVSNVTICPGQTATFNASAPGAGGFQWFDWKGVQVGTSASSYTTVPLMLSREFKVRTVTTGMCNSPDVSVWANVAAIPEDPMLLKIGAVYGSGSTTVTAMDVEGYTTKWYSAAGTYLSSGSSFTTPPISSTTNFLATSVMVGPGCESSPIVFTVDVKPVTPPSVVQTEVVKVAGKKLLSEIIPDNEKISSYTYMDGLARPVQQIAVKASPTGRDIVQPFEYDKFGRASKNYLPYTSTTTNGSFNQTFAVDQSAFYQVSNDKIANDTKAYAISVYESSPLGRPVEQGGVGDTRQPGTGHTMRATYSFNTGAADEKEGVRLFNSDGTSSGYFTANKLHRIETTDAHGAKTISFANSRGKTIAVKQEVNEGTGVIYLETYYIYDDFDRIKFIISPKGVDILRSTAWNLSATMKNNYAHQFVYDTRGRLIEKKVPGQEWMYFVYDPMNRLVLSQDGNSNNTNQWFFAKYDSRNRIVIQGLYTSTYSRAQLQTTADGLYTAGHATYPTTSRFESRSGSPGMHGYTSVSYPKDNIEVHNVTYYDDYDFDRVGAPADYAYTAQGLANEGLPISNTMGLVTGTKSAFFVPAIPAGSLPFLMSCIFYDKHHRAIQVLSNNHVNGLMDNLITNVYDFTGKLVETKTNHKVGTSAKVILQKIQYDAMGRVTDIQGPAPIIEDVAWQAGTNVTKINTQIKKTSGTTLAWNAGTASSNSLPAAADGFVQFKTDQTNAGKMVGLNTANIATDVAYQTIPFAIYLRDDARVEVYEMGVSKGTYGLYTINDVFTIERVGGKIYYKKNGQQFYESVTQNNNALYVDCSIYTMNGTVSAARLVKQNEVSYAHYEYNQLGQLVDKKLHYASSTFLQSVDYRYTIQGQLESINNAALDGTGESNDDSNDMFGMEFLYDKIDASGLGNTPQYNGNISAMKWRGQYNGDFSQAGVQKKLQRSFKYSYDKINRLLGAVSQSSVAANDWSLEAGALTESTTYDRNGNIKTLNRYDRRHQLSAAMIATYINTPIDLLNYTYNSAIGDKLEKVDDTSGSTKGFDNKAALTTEYIFDANGNEVTDENKDIDNIVYNHLGKPVEIVYGTGKKVTYMYDARGVKLNMTTYQSATPQSSIDYVQGFVYEDNKLSFYAIPEGRVVMDGQIPETQYAITDNQGNTRLIFTSRAPTVSETKVTFEATSNSEVLNYPSSSGRIMLYNTTPGGAYSQRLTGASGSQVGVAKSFAVFPGDKVKIEAYAKYLTPSGTTSNLVGFATQLINAFGLSAPLPGETGTPSAALKTWGTYAAGGNNPAPYTAPKAFVNILIYDKDYNFLDVATNQVEAVSGHDYLMSEYIAKEAGYVYMYISNENATVVDVHFDDVTFTYTPSNVIQYNEYYPFGLQASTSWTRTGSENNFLYNQSTERNETTGFYDLHYRNYDPVLGRFLQVDPLATMYANMSSYHYAGNNPVMLNDPLGDKWFLNTGGSMYRRIYDANHAWENHGNASGYDQWMRDSGFDDWAATGFGLNGGGHGDIGISSIVRQALGGLSTLGDGESQTYWNGPMIYNRFCECRVNAYEVLAHDPAHQLSEIREWAQTAVTVYESRGQMLTAFANFYKKRNIDEFYTAYGKWDLRANSIIGILDEVAEISYNQIRGMGYYSSKTIQLAGVSAKYLKWGGYVGAAIGVIVSGYEMYENGFTWSAAAKFGTGLIITTIAFMPGIGLPAAIILGSIEASGGFDNFYNSFENPVARRMYLNASLGRIGGN
jgi:RHS repeat-associated protein